ncbi:MAG: hypothetical protein J6T25_03555 [Bacilli bacterium]|nr:hypothetical protein [Bacilli bacterium]
MKKIISVIKLVVVIILLTIVFWFLFFSIGTPILFYLDSIYTIKNRDVILIVFIVVSLMLSLVITAIIMYSINRYNKLSKFVMTHLRSLLTFLILLSIFSVAIYNSSHVDLTLCDSLLGIEWAIFGVSAAIFLFRIQNQEAKIEQASTLNPDEMIGKQRLEQVSFINNLKEEFSDMNFVLVFLIINAFFLTLFSGGLFFLDRAINKEVLSLLFTLSLFFTTNTFVQVFMDVVTVFSRKKKALLEKPYMKKDYDIIIETIVCAFEEELFVKALNDIDLDDTLSDSEKKQKREKYLREYLQLKKEKLENKNNDPKRVEESSNNEAEDEPKEEETKPQ